MHRFDFLRAVADHTSSPDVIRQAELFADAVDTANAQLPTPKYDYPTTVVVTPRSNGGQRVVMSEATLATDPLAQQLAAGRTLIRGSHLLTGTPTS